MRFNSWFIFWPTEVQLLQHYSLKVYFYFSSIHELRGDPKLEPELGVKRMGFGASSVSICFHDLGRVMELLVPKFVS